MSSYRLSSVVSSWCSYISYLASSWLMAVAPWIYTSERTWQRNLLWLVTILLSVMFLGHFYSFHRPHTSLPILTCFGEPGGPTVISLLGLCHIAISVRNYWPFLTMSSKPQVRSHVLCHRWMPRVARWGHKPAGEFSEGSRRGEERSAIRLQSEFNWLFHLKGQCSF